MRNRNIVIVCVAGLVAVMAGVLIFGKVSDGGDGGSLSRGPGQSGRAGVLTIGGPFFNQLFERDAPDASQPVTSATATPARSTAGGSTPRSTSSGGAAAVARFVAPQQQPARVCAPSLLGSLLGLLGGGSGC